MVSQRTTAAPKTSDRRRRISMKLLSHVRERLSGALRLRDGRPHAESRTRETPSAPTRMFCGDTSRRILERRSCFVRSLREQHGETVQEPTRHRRSKEPASECPHGAPREGRERLAVDVLHDEEELAVGTTSSVGTTLGWRIRAASRASSRNIETNSGVAADEGISRDGHGNYDRARSRPRCTVAMPPTISPMRRMAPNDADAHPISVAHGRSCRRRLPVDPRSVDRERCGQLFFAMRSRWRRSARRARRRSEINRGQ